jgi:hypothetical protein
MGHDDSHHLDDDDAIAADSDATAAEGGSGDGGDLGTPSSDLAEEPPSEPQERNEAVSGGGMANTTEDGEPGPELTD